MSFKQRKLSFDPSYSLNTLLALQTFCFNKIYSCPFRNTITNKIILTIINVENKIRFEKNKNL